MFKASLIHDIVSVSVRNLLFGINDLAGLCYALIMPMYSSDKDHHHHHNNNNNNNNNNNMPLNTADFAMVPPPGERDETYSSSLTLADLLHYVKTWRHSQTGST